MKILMVDDDAGLRSACTRTLEREGHDVSAVESAEKAFEAVAKESFDLLVTDVGLPGISGDALAVSVRRSHPQTDVIIVTGAWAWPWSTA